MCKDCYYILHNESGFPTVPNALGWIQPDKPKLGRPGVR
jgi:hypothetical protein